MKSLSTKPFLNGLLLGILAGASVCLAEETSLVATDFPLGERLWMSVSRANIEPARSKTEIVTAEGDVEIRVADGQAVKKGEIWAVSKPTRLALAKESLLLEQRTTAEKLELMELDHLDELSANAERLATLRAEESELLAAGETVGALDDPALEQRVQQALSTLKDEIARMEKRAQLLEGKKAFQTERDTMELDLKKRQNEYDELKASSEYVAAFDGTVSLLIEDMDPGQRFPATLHLEAGSNLASLTDTQTYGVKFPATSPELTKVPQESLFVVINPVNEPRRFEAEFSHIELNPKSPAAPRTMVFTVPEKSRSVAEDLEGRQILAHTYCRLPEGTRLIPKRRLTEALAEQPVQLDWAQLIRELLPDYEVFAVGRRAVAVHPSE